MRKRRSVSPGADRKSVLPDDRKKLIQLILTLSREMAALREDNQQLRAAVAIYRGIAQAREGARSASDA